MKKLTALGPNLIIRVSTGEVKIGNFIVATEGSREAMARDEAVIEQLGEDAFSDLKEENRPVVGTKIAIARYDGKILEETSEYTKRVIADTRVLAIIEEV